MSQAIKIPGSNPTPQYIEGIRVTYKAASGVFNYYDGARQDVESITGVIVGWGFQFDTTKGKPSAKKSASSVSNEFGFEALTNNAPIKMRDLCRENGEFTSVPAGSNTYKGWKEAGHRLTKIVYIMDVNLGADGKHKIFKVQFSGLSFGAVNKLLKDDMPQYLCTLTKSDETVSTENGDFYMPNIIKQGDAPDDCYDAIVENVTFIYNILNNTDEVGYEVEQTAIPATGATANSVFGIGDDDIP